MHFSGALSLLALVAPRADAIDSYIEERMKTDHTPGICIAVVPPGGTADVRAYGVANLETGTPYTPDTVHRVASLSKQFCAYATLSLIKEGKLSADDNLRKFFPKGPEEWSKITIRQMLSHRSGIAEPASEFSYRLEYGTDGYVDVLSKKPLAEEPGSKYRYNNHGYALLGLVVGQVSQSTLEDQITKRIFQPLGMTTARYYRGDEVIPNRSNAYRWQASKHTRPLDIRPRIFHGSGGILMSMRDFVKYEMGLRKEETLDRDVLHKQRETYDGKDGYGAGWMISRPGGKLLMQHTGSTFGFTSAFIREVDEGWSVVVFRNCDEGDVVTLARQVLKLAKEAQPYSVSWNRGQ